MRKACRSWAEVQSFSSFFEFFHTLNGKTESSVYRYRKAENLVGVFFQFVDNRGFEFPGKKFRGFQIWTLDLGTKIRRSIISSLFSEQSSKGWLFSLFIFPYPSDAGVPCRLNFLYVPSTTTTTTFSLFPPPLFIIVIVFTPPPVKWSADPLLKEKTANQ